MWTTDITEGLTIMSNKTILETSEQLDPQKTILDQEINPAITSISLTSFRGNKIIEEFKAIGAEADVYLIEKGNKEYFLKLYRKGINLNADILKTIKELSHSYTYFAELFEYGFDESLGRYYELSEYIENGDLKHVVIDSSNINALIVSLNEALSLLHKNQIIHRDLKPNNILLRNTDPLNLVLVDFGVSSVIADDMTKVLTTLKGTYAYTAPEVMSGYIGKEVDYFSLGMIVLELLNKNPFSDLDGAAVLHTLATTNIEIPKNIDNKLKLLLKGLLTRDPKKRWGYNQVNAWIAGQSPEIHFDEIEKEIDNTQKYKFKDAYYTKKELAQVFVKQENFEDALKHIGRGYITKYLEKIEEFDATIQLDEYSTPLEKLINFIYSQQKGLPLSLYGVVVDKDHLFGLLLKYTQGDMSEVDKKLFELLTSQNLSLLIDIYETATNRDMADKDFILSLPKDRDSIYDYLDLPNVVKNGDIEHARVLVSHMESTSEDVLLIALEQQNKDMINLLLSKIINISDEHFDEAITYAIKLSDLTIVDAILKVNSGFLSTSILDEAIQSKDRDIVEVILERIERLSATNIKNLISRDYTYLIDNELIEESDISSATLIVLLLQYSQVDLLQKLFSSEEISNLFLQYIQKLNTSESLDNIPVDNFLAFNQKHKVMNEEAIFSAAFKSQHIKLIKYLSNILNSLPEEKDELFNTLVENDDIELFQKYENNFTKEFDRILYSAIKTYKKELARYLIARVDSLPNKVLFLAIATDQLDVVKMLIEHGVSVNVKGKHGDCALKYSILKERESIAKFLIENSAKIDGVDKNGSTLLHEAIKRNYKELVTLFLGKGINPNMQDEEGNTPLHIALEEKRLYFAEELIAYGANNNIINNSGQSSKNLLSETIDLRNFTISNNFKDIKKLIRLGFNINQKDSETGKTLLHLCIEHPYKNYGVDDIVNHIPFIKLLFNNGADPNIQDSDGNTPLHCLSKYMYTDQYKNILQIFLYANGKLDIKNKSDECSIGAEYDFLEKVLNEWEEELILEMIQKGLLVCNGYIHSGRSMASIYYNDVVGAYFQYRYYDSLLNIAIRHKSKNIVNLLLQKGLKINKICAKDRIPPLHLACKVGAPEIVQLLLTNGYDSNMLDDFKKPPIYYVITGYDEEGLFLSEDDIQRRFLVMQVLIRSGADIQWKNETGKTLLNYSYERLGNDNKISLLLKQHNVKKQGFLKFLYLAWKNAENTDFPLKQSMHDYNNIKYR